MTTTLNYIKDQQQTSDLPRQAQRHRRRRKVRRVAVIRPAGSHFKLLPPGQHVKRQPGGRGRRIAGTHRSPIDGSGPAQSL